MTTANLIIAITYAAGLISVVAMVLVPLVLTIRYEFFRARSGSRANNTSNWIAHVTEFAGSVAVVAVVGLVVSQFSVVLLRYFFSTGSIELQEIVVYFHAMIFMLGVGITLMKNEHVRLDIFYAKLKPRARASVNLAGTTLLLIPFALTVAVTGFDYVSRSWATSESSVEVSGLNYVYLLKTVILVFTLLLLLQAVNWIFDALRVLRGHGQQQGSPPVSELDQ